MQWPMFNRVEQQARRLDDMMSRIGVAPVELARLRGGEAYAEARRTCLRCHVATRCHRWLANPRHAELDDANLHNGGERPDFCPNLAVLELVARLDPSSRLGVPDDLHTAD